uniref:Uncharacterized protein n=1 Tax=Parascaris equorum TaxID=6256 RepID=A0A914S7M6_PAREQ
MVYCCGDGILFSMTVRVEIFYPCKASIEEILHSWK